MPIGATYIAYRLFKEALHRVTGIDREASFATTVFAAGVLATPFLAAAASMLRALRPPRLRHPSAANSMMGVSLVRYAARSIGGEPLREAPFADVLIASSLLAPAFQVILLPVHMVRAVVAGVARAWRYTTRPATR